MDYQGVPGARGRQPWRQPLQSLAEKMSGDGEEVGYVLDLEARLRDYLKSPIQKKLFKLQDYEKRISWEGVRFMPAATPNYSTGDGQLPTLNPCILDNSEFVCENNSEKEQTFSYKVSHKSVFRFRAEFDSCIQAVRTEHGPELLMPLIAPPELQAKNSNPRSRFPMRAADQRVLYLRSRRSELTEQVGTHEVNATVCVPPGRKMRVTTEVVEKSFCQMFSQPIRITGKIVIKCYGSEEFKGKNIPVTALFNEVEGQIETIPTDILSVHSDHVRFVVRGNCMCQMTGQMTTKTEEIT